MVVEVSHTRGLRGVYAALEDVSRFPQASTGLDMFLVSDHQDQVERFLKGFWALWVGLKAFHSPLRSTGSAFFVVRMRRPNSVCSSQQAVLITNRSTWYGTSHPNLPSIILVVDIPTEPS